MSRPRTPTPGRARLGTRARTARRGERARRAARSSRQSARTRSPESGRCCVPPCGASVTARSFSPAIRSRTVPSRAMRNRSGVTSPATTTSPSPHAASTTSSSSPSIGLRVKRTPAQSASTSSCRTTPTRGVPSKARSRAGIRALTPNGRIAGSPPPPSIASGGRADVEAGEMLPGEARRVGVLADGRGAEGKRRPKGRGHAARLRARGRIAAASASDELDRERDAARDRQPGVEGRCELRRLAAVAVGVETLLERSGPHVTTSTSPARPSTRTCAPSASDGGGVAAADDGGDAELPRDDRRVREQAAAVGDDARRAAAARC